MYKSQHIIPVEFINKLVYIKTRFISFISADIHFCTHFVLHLENNEYFLHNKITMYDA